MKKEPVVAVTVTKIGCEQNNTQQWFTVRARGTCDMAVIDCSTSKKTDKDCLPLLFLGSTGLPMVQGGVEAKSDTLPCYDDNPMEVASIGASLV